MHLGALHGEADAAVLGLLHQGLSVHQLPAARVRRPVLGSVHRHLTTKQMPHTAPEVSSRAVNVASQSFTLPGEDLLLVAY